MNRFRLCVTGALLPLMSVSQLVAQSEPQELEAFISEEVPIEESILPTSRPFNSVYGTDRSILDTPRNVTIISREQLDAISIKTPRDFARLTSSSYTKSNFGAPTTPNLRGQEADLFVNGIRKGLTSNGNGLPINFNAVESVNIVKGPAGAVYGSSNYLGGYADLITKRAFFDAARGSASFTLGSFDTRYWQLDYSAPVSDELAYRISYSGEDSGGFKEFAKRKTQALYATFTYRPSDNYELFVAAEYFVADYTEDWGVNRPTQDLIDHGLYIPNAQTDEEYFAYIAQLGNGDSVFGGGQAGVDFASQFGGAGFATISPLDTANPVKLNRKKRLLAPGDDSFGKNFWAQAIQSYTASDTMKIVNNTYFQWIDRNTFSSYHYSELLRDNWSLDNRFAVVIEKDTWDLNTGLRFRWQDVWSVNHFFNEPVNFWDLTRPANEGNSRRVPDAGFAGAPYIPDEEPRGILEHWYYGETGGDTQGYILGPFAQLTLRPSDKVIIDLGLGIDQVHGEDKHPVLGVDGTFDFNQNGVIDADSIEDAGYLLEETATLLTFNTSIIYKASETLSLYGTYGYSESSPAETGGRFDVANFNTPQESKLFELGAKFNLLDEKLFVGTAIVDRSFVTSNPDGTSDNVELTAFEIEFNYQPNRNFYATVGYSWIDSKRTVGFYATGYTADRADETGGFYVSPTFPSPEGQFDYPGNPDHQFVGLVSYEFDNGFGLRANLVITGPMKLGYDGFDFFVFDPEDANGGYFIPSSTAEIPWQYELDLTAFYTYEDWDFKVTVFNITDEENWDAPNAGYGNGSVVAREPLKVEGTVTWHF